jgi:tRNA(Arg) A34 adenosine deaminase TadA
MWVSLVLGLLIVTVECCKQCLQCILFLRVDAEVRQIVIAAIVPFDY